jgi:sulfotransferase
MEYKKFYFIAGLQRSGGTLMSAIFNQNPDIWAAPTSPLLGMMTTITDVFESQPNKDFDRSLDVVNTLKRVPQNFYGSRNETHILDKNHLWSRPDAVGIIHKYIQEDLSKIKIICPVRNIVEILASFNTIIEKTPESIGNNNIDIGAAEFTAPDLPDPDRRAEFLMMPNQDIATHLYGMRQALNPQYRHIFHFVEYEDLVSKTEETMNGVYDFLEIDRFKHDFSKLKSQEKPDSSTGMYNLHTVRPVVEKKSVDPSSIFSPEIIQKYSNIEFWRYLK